MEHHVATRMGKVAIDVRGDGPPLFLLHAVAHDRRDFDAIVPQLAREMRTVTVDWPGHGASDAFDPPSSASAAALCDVLEDVVDALDLPPAVFLGSSVGATASVRFASRHAARARGLVLVAPGGFSGRSPLVGAAGGVQGREIVRRHTGGAFARWYVHARTAETSALLQRIEETRRRPGFTATDAAIWRSFASPEADMSEAARTITCPTLFVFGKHDPVIRASVEGRRARSLVPHASSVALDTGHVPFVEAPDDFLAAVLPFVRNARPPANDAAAVRSAG